MSTEEMRIQISADIAQAQQNLNTFRQALANATNPTVINRLSNRILRFGRNLMLSQRALSRLGTETQGVNNNSLSNMTTKTTDIFNGLQMVGNSLSNLISKFNILGDVAGFALDKIKEGIMHFISSGHDFAKTMEQQTLAFEVLLGSAEKANKMMDNLSTMASVTPFELPDLAKSTKQLLAMGFAAEGIPYVLKNIGNAASATGLGAEGLNRITRAITQMSAKGKIGAEEMTRQLGELVPAWSILAKKMGKSVAEVQEMSRKGTLEVQKSLELLIEGFGEKFPNLMKKLSRTWDGLMSTIRDNLAQISAFMQKHFFNTAKKGLAVIADALTEMMRLLKATKKPLLAIQITLQKFFGKDVMIAIMPLIMAITNLFNAMAKIIISSIQSIAPVIIFILGELAPVILFLSELIVSLGDGFKGLSPTMQNIITIGGLLISIFVAILPVFIGLVTMLSGAIALIVSFGIEIGLVIIALAGLFTQVGVIVGALVIYGIALYQAWKNSEIFRQIVTEQFKILAMHIAKIIDNIAIIWGILGKFLMKVFNVVWPVIVKIVATSFIGIMVSINGFLQLLNGLSEILAGTFTGNWSKIWNGVKIIFGDAFNSIIRIGMHAINAVLWLVNKGIGGLNKVRKLGGKKQYGKLKYLTGHKTITYDMQPSKKGVGIKFMKSLKAIFGKAKKIFKGFKKFKLPKLKLGKLDTSKPAKMFSGINKGLDKMGKAAKKAGKKGKKYKTVMEKVRDRVQDFVKSMQDKAKALINFGNLFEKTIIKKFSGTKLRQALESQLDYLRQWRYSLQKLAGRIGKDSALYLNLLSKGPESAGEVKAIAHMTDQELKKYMKLFDEKTKLAYQMGFEMQAGEMTQNIYNQKMIFNITGNKISEELDIDLIANKIIEKLKYQGVY